MLRGTNLEGCTNYVSKPVNGSGYLTCFDGFKQSASNSLGVYVTGLSNLNQFLLFYVDLTDYAVSQGNSQATLNEKFTFTLYEASL